MTFIVGHSTFAVEWIRFAIFFYIFFLVILISIWSITFMCSQNTV